MPRVPTGERNESMYVIVNMIIATGVAVACLLFFVLPIRIYVEPFAWVREPIASILKSG